MKSFLIYAVRRIFLLIPFLIGLTILAFLLGVLAPGDPAMAVLTMDGTAEPTASELLAMRESMGLDQPFWMQYGSWLTHAAVGDLGVSYLTHRPVLSELMRRFPVTLHLALWAMGWVILLGIPAGIWAARRKGHAAEIGLELVALFFISMPSFWLGIMMMLTFSEEWQLLPSSGYGDALHMILPSFVLAAGTAAAVLRLEQTSVLSVMEKPFLMTERAKGLSASYIEIYHVQFADAGHYHAGNVFCLDPGRLGHYRESFFHTRSWKLCTFGDLGTGLSGDSGLCAGQWDSFHRI